MVSVFWESHALSSPFPFPLCVPRLSSPCVSNHSHVLSCPPHVCVVVATHQHCAPLCCFLSSLLFLCVFHHHPSSPLVCVKRVCAGKVKEDEQTCVIQKSMWKKGVQREKQKTTCGVNTLSPTLVPTTPTHPSLHSSHHKSCFPLAVALTLYLLLFFWLDDKRQMV